MRATGGQRRVDEERIAEPGLRDGVRKPGRDEVLEAVEIGGRERDAGRHGMAAALQRDAGLDGGAHGAADVGAGDGARRADEIAVAVGGEREGRPVEALLQPRRDKPDDSRMPIRRGRDDDRRVGSTVEHPQRLRLGLGDRGLLDLLALAVEPVELRRDAVRLHGVVAEQQARAERRVADAAAGVDARSDEEAEVPALGRLGEAGGIEERGEAEAPALAHDGEALAHEGAVEAMERHHVGDRRERDEIEAREQVGLGSPGPEAAHPKLAVERHEREEDDAGGAQMPEPREVVLPVRVDDRRRCRQHLRRLVMVEDDGVELKARRLGERLVAHRCRNRR